MSNGPSRRRAFSFLTMLGSPIRNGFARRRFQALASATRPSTNSSPIITAYTSTLTMRVSPSSSGVLWQRAQRGRLSALNRGANMLSNQHPNGTCHCRRLGRSCPGIAHAKRFRCGTGRRPRRVRPRNIVNAGRRACWAQPRRRWPPASLTWSRLAELSKSAA